MDDKNKLHFNPFVTPCKNHGSQFNLNCKACVDLIKDGMFENETKWNHVLAFDEVVDFMKKRNMIEVTKC